VPGSGGAVGDLVSPAERSEVIAMLSRRAQERDPDIVDGERVPPERAGGLLWSDELAPSLDAGWDQFDSLRPDERQVVEACSSSAWAYERGQPARGELSENLLGPSAGAAGHVHLVNLRGGQEPVLVDARQHLRSDLRERRGG
jgi:hypothetical protein